MNLHNQHLIYKGETFTGAKFSDAVICSVECNKKNLRILFDRSGDPLNDLYVIDRITDHYGFDFMPGFLDGKPCYYTHNPI